MDNCTELLTVPEVAETLRISESGVYRLIETKRMPHTKIGKRRYAVSRAQLAEFIAASAVPAAVGAPSNLPAPAAVR